MGEPESVADISRRLSRAMPLYSGERLFFNDVEFWSASVPPRRSLGWPEGGHLPLRSFLVISAKRQLPRSEFLANQQHGKADKKQARR